MRFITGTAILTKKDPKVIGVCGKDDPPEAVLAAIVRFFNKIIKVD